ncbi:MAG: FRG domain-containing protein [Bacteroidales bacterium]
MEQMVNGVYAFEEFPNWASLVEKLTNHANSPKIYRGHSNSYKYFQIKERGRIKRKVIIESWELISSFNRFYSSHEYLFRTYLKQQFADQLFRKVYGRYEFNEIFFLKDCSLTERLYYLQHYGVPTCFLDFTKDPLIALYFAISSVKASNGGALDSNGNPYYHPAEPYISIIEINHERITQLLHIKHLQKDSILSVYDDYDMFGCHIAFDINPIENCQKNTLNKNLIKQNGSFILYDNNNTSLSLDRYILSLMNKLGIEKEILIKEYRLPYNKIFHKESLEGFDNIKLFNFLDKHNATGRTLFNDINGLKYDLNFFHNS